LFRAAILIPLFLHHNEIHVLLTQRSKSLKTHAGDVCFPGGKYDETDLSLLNTAFRETYEEIGLKPEHVTILGRLVPLTTIHGIVVFPFVGLINDLEKVELKLNLDEVEVVFACPVQTFLASATYIHHSAENNRHYSFSWHSNPNLFPYSDNKFLSRVFCENGNESFLIWGLTGLYSIIVASICLNQQPKFTSFVFDEVLESVIQHLQNYLVTMQQNSKL